MSKRETTEHSKDTNVQTPERLVRMTAGQPDIDLEGRQMTFRVTTRLLARDGGIVLPEGIVTKWYESNPVVGIRHMLADWDSPRPLVAGRALTLERDARGMSSRMQFADSELGREWGYLYGLNPEGEVYMRAVSFAWSTMARETWTIDEAREYLGEDWDEDAVPEMSRRYNEVWVAKRSEMHEYSLVEVGADREALSRALSDGVRTAGEILTRMDLGAARREIDNLKQEGAQTGKRLAKLEADLQALAGDGAEAARRGDSSALLGQVRELRSSLTLRSEINQLKGAIKK